MTTATTESSEATLIEGLVDAQRVRLAANSSQLVVWASAAILMLVLVLWVVFQKYTQLLAVAVSTLPITVGAGLCSFLQRQGRPRLGIYLMIISLLLSVVAIEFFLPPVLPAVAMGFTLAILMGYLLVGDRPGRWLMGIAALDLAFVIILPNVWYPGWFPRLDEQISWILAMATGVAALLGYGIILRAVVMGQEGSFRQAQRANREVERRAAAELEERQHLQSTVEQYVAFMARVALGDLSVRFSLPASTSDGDDPLLRLGDNLNGTVASLQQMTLRIRDTSADLASASAEILAATAQQARAANEQCAASVQATTTIDEIRSIANQTALRAQSVAELAQHAADVSRAGQQAVAQTIEGMGQIKRKVESIASNVLSLSEQAQTIGGIVASVSEIAAQSNILALNAAIEAARAGESGRGFAVVAGEVRSLAEQSRGATVQVKEILSQIQRGVNTSVMATEEGMKGTDAGVRLAAEAGEAIRRQDESVTESTHAAQQIAAAATQQLAGVEQVAQAVQSIDQATAQTLAGARQAERAAEDLNTMANRLRALVGQYRL
jgi:methyl-accepting chemotaxis protein